MRGGGGCNGHDCAPRGETCTGGRFTTTRRGQTARSTWGWAATTGEGGEAVCRGRGGYITTFQSYILNGGGSQKINKFTSHKSQVHWVGGRQRRRVAVVVVVVVVEQDGGGRRVGDKEGGGGARQHN